MDFTEFSKYPVVDNFVRLHLSMQLDDVHAMLRLPLPEVGIRAGCNLAATATLCNLISGISVVLFKPKMRMEAGERFKELLRRYYPWEPEENKEEVIEIIYNIVRNGLSHRLALRKRNGISKTLQISKNRLNEERILEIEKSTKRPVDIPIAVTDLPTVYVLSVEGLYWGVIQLLRKIAQDDQSMHKAQMKLLTDYQ